MGNLEEICEQQDINVTLKFLCIKLWTVYIHAVTSFILGEILQISISPFGRGGEEENWKCPTGNQIWASGLQLDTVNFFPLLKLRWWRWNKVPVLNNNESSTFRLVTFSDFFTFGVMLFIGKYILKELWNQAFGKIIGQHAVVSVM